MNIIFFLFMITVYHDGSEQLNRYNAVNYQSRVQCEKSLKQIKVKKNQTLFCGEDYLFFNKGK